MSSLGCAAGYVDDAFLTYTVIPCYLNQHIHYALSVFWMTAFAFFFAELLISRASGLVRAKLQGFGGQLLQDVVYCLYLLGSVVLFAIVVGNNNASVFDKDVGAGLWLGVWGSLSGMLLFAASMAINNSIPLIAAVNVHNQSLEQKEKQTQVFVWIKNFQYTICLTYLAIAILCFIILPNSLSDFNMRQISINVGFIVFGVEFLLAMFSVGVTNECIIKIAKAQIKFERDLPGNENNDLVATTLIMLSKRLRYITIMMGLFGLFFAIAFVLVGSSVIQLSWIVVHVIFGALPFSGVLAYRLKTRDSLVSFAYWQNRKNHKESRGSSSEQAEPRVVKISNERSRSSMDFPLSRVGPSEMLATMNVSDLATPAHAILSMSIHDEDENEH